MKSSLFILFLVCFVSCNGQRMEKVNISFKGKKDFSNAEYFLIFEKYFDDTISINYLKREKCRFYAKTDKRVEAVQTICKIDSIIENQDIILSINRKHYFFTPIKNYRYYYITKHNSTIHITYSNIEREYY